MITMTNDQAERRLQVSRTMIDAYIKEGKLTPIGSRPRKFELKQVSALEKELRNNPKQPYMSNVKLTEEHVLEIRKKYEPRKYGYEKLGKDYGVATQTIQDIIQGKTWRNI